MGTVKHPKPDELEMMELEASRGADAIRRYRKARTEADRHDDEVQAGYPFSRTNPFGERE